MREKRFTLSNFKVNIDSQTLLIKDTPSMLTKSTFTAYWAFVLISIQFFFFTHSGELTLRDGHSIYFIFATAISLILFGIDGKKIPLKLLPMAILPVVMLFKIQSVDSFESIFQSMSIVSGILLFFQVSTKEIDLKLLGWVIALSCLIESAWIISMDRWEYDFYALITTKGRSNGISGGLGNRGFTGGFIVITMPFLLTKCRERLILAPLTLIPVIATYLVHIYGTTTPLAVLVFCCASVCTHNLLKYKPRLRIIAIRTIMLSIGLIMMIRAGEARWTIWGTVISIPGWWQGYGPGWIPEHFQKILIYKKQYFTHLHNEFIEAIFIFGPWALIPFKFISAATWVPRAGEMFQVWLSAACALLYSLTWPGFHLGAIAIVGIFMFGMLLSKENLQTDHT